MLRLYANTSEAFIRDFVVGPELHLVGGENNRVDPHRTGSASEGGGKI